MIGKSADKCDIILNDKSISEKHAKITVDENGKVILKNLSKSKFKWVLLVNFKKGILMVNGEKLAKKEKVEL